MNGKKAKRLRQENSNGLTTRALNTELREERAAEYREEHEELYLTPEQLLELRGRLEAN